LEYLLSTVLLTEKSPIRIFQAGHWWLRPVILATQEAEMRRMAVPSQLRQLVLKTLS
jgi:hypothetical protein